MEGQTITVVWKDSRISRGSGRQVCELGRLAQWMVLALAESNVECKDCEGDEGVLSSTKVYVTSSGRKHKIVEWTLGKNLNECDQAF